MSSGPCPAARRRAGMGDEDFWADVNESMQAAYGQMLEDMDVDPDADQVIDLEIEGECSVCGSTGACAYDSEGRPMIHCTEEDD